MSFETSKPTAVELVARVALSLEGTAMATSLSLRMVQTLANDPNSKFPTVRIGRRVLVPVRELEQWFTDHVGKELNK